MHFNFIIWIFIHRFFQTVQQLFPVCCRRHGFQHLIHLFVTICGRHKSNKGDVWLFEWQLQRVHHQIYIWHEARSWYHLIHHVYLTVATGFATVFRWERFFFGQGHVEVWLPAVLLCKNDSCWFYILHFLKVDLVSPTGGRVVLTLLYILWSSIFNFRNIGDKKGYILWNKWCLSGSVGFEKWYHCRTHSGYAGWSCRRWSCWRVLD